MAECRNGSACRAEIAIRPDAILGDLARGQHGIVGRDQLLARGLSRHTIDRLRRAGRLVSLHSGVFAVGHAQLRPQGFRLSAVLAGGPGARLSHRSGSAGWGLIEDRRTTIDITVPPRSAHGLTLPGLIVHRARLAEVDCAEVDGIPVTSVARTLVDLAGSSPRRLVARAVDAAFVQRLYDQRAVDEILRRERGRRGVAVLRAVLEERHPDAHLVRSELEAIALEKLMASSAPPPRVNAWLAEPGLEVDLLWEEDKLVVELDGRRYHAHRAHRDRERDRLLTAAGYRVRRFGWGDVTAGPFVAETTGELRRVSK